jgi:hypothetical protein
VQVEQTNEHADHHMGYEPQVSQDLWKGSSQRRMCPVACPDHTGIGPTGALDGVGQPSQLLESYSPKGQACASVPQHDASPCP